MKASVNCARLSNSWWTVCDLAVTQPGSKTDPDRAAQGTTALGSNILQGRGRTAPPYHSLRLLHRRSQSALRRSCPCARNRHHGRLLTRVVGLGGVILEDTLDEYRVVKCPKVEGPDDEGTLHLCEGRSLRLRRSTASTDVVRRQNMLSLCNRGRNVYHTLHEHCPGLPIDTGVFGSKPVSEMLKFSSQSEMAIGWPESRRASTNRPMFS